MPLPFLKLIIIIIVISNSPEFFRLAQITQDRLITNLHLKKVAIKMGLVCQVLMRMHKKHNCLFVLNNNYQNVAI